MPGAFPERAAIREKSLIIKYLNIIWKVLNLVLILLIEAGSSLEKRVAARSCAAFVTLLSLPAIDVCTATAKTWAEQIHFERALQCEPAPLNAIYLKITTDRRS